MTENYHLGLDSSVLTAQMIKLALFTKQSAQTHPHVSYWFTKPFVYSQVKVNLRKVGCK